MRPLPAIVLLCLLVAFATAICFGRFALHDAEALGISFATGFAAALLWWVGGFLPRRFAPTAGVTSLISAFVPAAFIPEAFFIGMGLLFMIACATAGGIFSFLFWLFFERTSNLRP